jgi:hypothetical protein
MQASLGEQLRAALNQWDREEKKEQEPASYQKTSPFQITNNLNREAFARIQRAPGTRKQITQDLVAQGFKLGSVSAVLGHMLRQGVAQVDDEGLMHVTVPEYVPLKSSQTLRNMEKKKAAQGRKKVVVVPKKAGEKRPVSSSVGGIAALSPAPAPTLVPAATPAEQFVFKLLESLTVLQARAVYDELKKIFGESK